MARKIGFGARLRRAAKMLWGASGGRYEGAAAQRRLKHWRPGADSMSALVAADGELLRRRARDLVRNNPYAAAACESFVANVVGTGIKPSSLVDDAEAREALHILWTEWTDEADADGLTDFYGLQALVARALFEAGEAFIRLRPRRAEDGLSVPLQIQVLESDMVPFDRNQKEGNGNETINGVEFDLRGKRVAYWMFKQHPGDQAIRGNTSAMPVRVPASEVIHVFRPLRPGQVRGVPWIAPAMLKLWLLDQYDDAELDRKKTAAMFAGFVRSPEPTELLPDDEGGALDQSVVTLEPGTMQVLNPGEEITFAQPADVGGAYEMFEYRNILAACAGMATPYYVTTGDLRKSNYSTLRGALVEYRRRIEQIQFSVIVFQMCRAVRMRWMDMAVLSGAVALPGFADRRRHYTRTRWITPRAEWVDPLKDIQAEKIAVDNLFKPRSDVVESMGYDPEENDRRIASDQAREDALALRRGKDAAIVAAPDDLQQEVEDAAEVAIDDAQAA